MSMVGPDKRMNYYRLTPDEVIAALHGHKMGLTNAEAKRRGEVQQNTLTEPEWWPLVIRYIIQAQPLLLLSLLAALGLSVQLGDNTLAVALAIVAFAHFALTWLLRNRRYGVAPSFATLLPAQASAVRNGQIEVVHAASLVVGDIVHLQASELVPADVRLLDVQNFITDDAAVLGGSRHTLKFTHALAADVPLTSRNNFAFAGTTVVAGQAHGIVTATGAQTELGRIQQLVHIQPSVPALFMNRSHHRQAVLFTVGCGSLLIVALFAAWGEAVDTSRIFLLMLVALIAGTSPLLEQVVSLRTRWFLVRHGIRIKRLGAVEKLGQVDILLCDPAAFGGNDASVVGVAIGRTAYTVSGNGYEPDGQVLGKQGKALTKKALHELALFFESAALAHHATVLPPDAGHRNWYAHGNPTDAALLTAGRRAGVQTEQLRAAHGPISLFPFDDYRQQGGIVREYGSDLVLFVHGSPEALLAHSSKLWDHGHVRPLTARDTAQFTNHHTRQAAAGLSCTAIAYRILPKNTNVRTLTMERAEQKLTFLGVMDIEYTAAEPARALIQAAQGQHVRLSLLANRASPYAIDSEHLRRLSDERLLDRLHKGSATFAQLTAEDKVRIVSIAQRAHHTVAMCGTNLSDLPALKLADVAFGPGTAANTWLDEAAAVEAGALEQIISMRSVYRHIADGLTYTLQASAISQCSGLALAILSTGAALFLHVPLAISPLQLLIALLVLQPLAAVPALGHAKPGKSRGTTRLALTFGIFAAALAFANFLAFFIRSGLGPEYLDPSSVIVAHAATITFASLVLCLGIDTLSRSRRAAADGHPRSKAIAGGLASIVLTLGIIYLQPLQALIATQGLDLADWVCILLTTALYASLHLLQHHTHQHSRRAVVQLHRKKFGTSSPSRV